MYHSKFLISLLSLILFFQIFGNEKGVSSTQDLTNLSLQDTKAAKKFFENELNFTTNPFGVKRVVDGKVKNVTIIDVRSRKEFKNGHIPGALNIPFDEHKTFEGDETEFKELRKDGFNYVYCGQKLCNLSAKACYKFASIGFMVKEVKGGFKSWIELNFPVER